MILQEKNLAVAPEKLRANYFWQLDWPGVAVRN